MKRLLLALTFALTLGASAQTTPDPAAPAPPASPAPAPAAAPAKPSVPTTMPDGSRYLRMPNLLQTVKANIAAMQGQPCDIIFIGDSITAAWAHYGAPIWREEYGPLHSLNFGVPGDGTQHVLWRLDNLNVKELKPKIAVIMIGTNNTGSTPQEIADGVKAVITKTQEVFSGVKVILMSITPNQRAQEKSMAADAIIKNFADGQSIYWVDLVPLMPPVTSPGFNGTTDHNWKGLGEDHLHPTGDGYRIWHDAMEPVLSKLLMDALTAPQPGASSPPSQTFYTPPQDQGGLKAPDSVNANLPNVLILGDSISIGYTPVVRKLLAGRANVLRPDANCGDTRAGLVHLDAWLGATKWDVIHFNWGLHDLCYRDPNSKQLANLDKVHGVISVAPEQYEKNLEQLVVRLEKTGAKLIWASTTVVPANEPGRFVGDDKKYNTIAARVMQRHGIPTDDLYALTVSFHGADSAGPGNVHYNAAGAQKIGQQVAAEIGKVLPAVKST